MVMLLQTAMNPQLQTWSMADDQNQSCIDVCDRPLPSKDEINSGPVFQTVCKSSACIVFTTQQTPLGCSGTRHRNNFYQINPKPEELAQNAKKKRTSAKAWIELPDPANKLLQAAPVSSQTSLSATCASFLLLQSNNSLGHLILQSSIIEHGKRQGRCRY